MMTFFAFELIHGGGQSPIFLFVVVTLVALACLTKGAVVAAGKAAPSLEQKLNLGQSKTCVDGAKEMMELARNMKSSS
jgi:hypothetical protein